MYVNILIRNQSILNTKDIFFHADAPSRNGH